MHLMCSTFMFTSMHQLHAMQGLGLGGLPVNRLYVPFSWMNWQKERTTEFARAICIHVRELGNTYVLIRRYQHPYVVTTL